MLTVSSVLCPVSSVLCPVFCVLSRCRSKANMEQAPFGLRPTLGGLGFCCLDKPVISHVSSERCETLGPSFAGF